MKKILCGLAMLAMMSIGAMAQVTPPAAGLYLFNGTDWTPDGNASGYGSIPYTPAAFAAYCYNGTAWTPCTAGGGGGATLPYPGIVYATSATAGTVATPAQILGSFSTNVVYASKVAGATGGQAVIPGSSATGDPNSWTALNAITSAGNVDLEVDSGFALSAALNLGSNTTIHCTAPQNGFIMQAGANAPVLQNLHLNAPTTSSGTTGYLVSNQADSNIRVIGCQLNANATQAVTGTNSVGQAHGATPGGQFVYTTNFVGVNGLTLEHNEGYDPGAFNFFFSNDSLGSVNYNYLHYPVGSTKSFTDCLHWTGPNTTFAAAGNTLTCGDDSIAFNADDGNYPSSGDANSTYIASYVKWGVQQNMHVNDTVLLNSYDGIRTLSETNLIDNVSVSNTTGNICGIFGSFYPAYAVATGNYGSVKIDGVSVADSWTCPTASFTHNFIMEGGSFNPLQIGHLNISNPGQPYPLFYQYASGASGSTRLTDWTVNTKTATVGSIVNTATNPGQISVSGLNWNDSIGSGTVFAGATVPTNLTCSNYTGPNLLLAAGYAPTYQNGDCFTNTYPVATTYINTIFNEASSGTVLAGTTPATCTNGCVGPWTLASGTDFTYQTGGGVQTATTNGVSDLINTGQLNPTIRYTVTTCTGTGAICAFNVRYTNGSNFVAINMCTDCASGGPAVQVYNVNAGTATQINANLTGTITGNYEVVLNGTAITVTNSNGQTGGAMSGTPSTSGTDIGFQSDMAGETYKLTSLSAKSF